MNEKLDALTSHRGSFVCYSFDLHQRVYTGNIDNLPIKYAVNQVRRRILIPSQELEK